MAITLIENLDNREGLELHRNLAAFNGAARSVALLTYDQRKASFQGQVHKDMHTLALALNEQASQWGVEVAGVAGKHILSAHFQARDKDELKAITQEDFVIEASKCGLYMQQAIVNWGNRSNKDLAAQGKPLIRFETTGEQTVKLVLPDIDTMFEFNRRQKLGFFVTEARNIQSYAEAPGRHAA